MKRKKTIRQRLAVVLGQWLADADTWPSQEAINLIPEVRELRTLGCGNTHIFCVEVPVQGAAILESHCEPFSSELPMRGTPLERLLRGPCEVKYYMVVTAGSREIADHGVELLVS